MSENQYDRRRRYHASANESLAPAEFSGVAMSGGPSIPAPTPGGDHRGRWARKQTDSVSGTAPMTSGMPLAPYEVDAYFHTLYADRELLGDLAGPDLLAGVVQPPTMPEERSAAPAANSGCADDTIAAWQASVRQLDEDYQQYRRQRYDESFDEFTTWRRRRDLAAYQRQLKARASGGED